MMGKGIHPPWQISRLDFAVAVCILAMIGFNIHALRGLPHLLETSPTMTATAKSILVSTDARPIAYCAWVRS